MSAHTMFSHTKEILGLAMPFFLVILVLSLFSAGVANNQLGSVQTQNDDIAIPAITVYVTPTIPPAEYAGKVEDNIVNQTDENPTGTPDPTSTPTHEPSATGTPQTGILLPEAASTSSSDLQECTLDDSSDQEATASCN